jgi:hypothetical protein
MNDGMRWIMKSIEVEGRRWYMKGGRDLVN